MYTPIVRIFSISVLIDLLFVYKFVIRQMNVKTAFLNNDLEEKIYINELEGCVVPGKENKV